DLGRLLLQGSEFVGRERILHHAVAVLVVEGANRFRIGVRRKVPGRSLHGKGASARAGKTLRNTCRGTGGHGRGGVGGGTHEKRRQRNMSVAFPTAVAFSETCPEDSG